MCILSNIYSSKLLSHNLAVHPSYRKSQTDILCFFPASSSSPSFSVPLCRLCTYVPARKKIMAQYLSCIIFGARYFRVFSVSIMYDFGFQGYVVLHVDIFPDFRQHYSFHLQGILKMSIPVFTNILKNLQYSLKTEAIH
jgi:hypothetical protein